MSDHIDDALTEMRRAFETLAARVNASLQEHERILEEFAAARATWEKDSLMMEAEIERLHGELNQQDETISKLSRPDRASG